MSLNEKKLKPPDTEVFPVYGSPIASSYFTYLWLFGLYRPSTTKLSSRSPSKRWFSFPHIYSYAATFVCITLVIVGSTDTITFFQKDIISLNFFVLIGIINNFTACLQIPFIFFVVNLSRTKTVKFLHDLSRVLHDLLPTSQFAQLKKRSTFFAFSWIAFWLIIACTGMLRYYWPMLNRQGLETGTAYTQFLGIPNVPEYLGLILSFIYWICITINVDLGSQIFYLVSIFWLSKAFKKVYENLCTIREGNLSNRDALQPIKLAGRKLQNLRFLTEDFNSAFGLLILINCIRDMIAIVCLIALLLDPADKRKNESEEAFQQRIVLWDLQDRWDYCYTSITLAQTVLRVTVCLHCQSQVKKIVRVLRKIKLEAGDLEAGHACAAMANKTDDTTGIISVAGVTFINRQYVIRLFGVLATYSIIVYQVRDAKVVDGERAMTYEVEPLMQRVTFAVNNFTQMLTNSCDW